MPALAFRATLTLALLVLAGCSASRAALDADVETREDLVRALEQGGYQVSSLQPQLFFGTPQPAAAYRVVQPDGRVIALLAYATPDADRGYVFNGAPGEFVGERSMGAPPKSFRKGDVNVYLYGFSRDTATSTVTLAQSQLYADLVSLLGSPKY